MTETMHVTAGGLRFLVTTPAVVPFTNTLADSTAPRGADEAAHRLLDDGEHVHLVSDGEPRCLNHQCTPAPVRGLLGNALPMAPRPRTNALPDIRPLI